MSTLPKFLRLFSLTILISTLPLAASDSFRVSKITKIPSCGISLMLPKSVVPQPPPAENMFTYKNNKGEKLEFYSPAELWARKQFIAMWRDEVGSLISIFRMEKLKPELKGPHPHFPREEFEKGWENATAITTKKRDTWMKWACSLLNTPYVNAPEKFYINKAKKVAIYRLLQSEGDYLYAAYSPYQKSPFLIRYQIAETVDKRKAKSGISKSLKSLEIGRKSKSSLEDKKSSRFQNKKVISKGKNSAEFEASRQRVITDIKNLKSWWYVATDNYILASDMGNKKRKLARQVQGDIEFLRAAYNQIIPPWSEIKDVSVIKIFDERANYLQYVGEEMQWSGGLWAPTKRELVISPLDFDDKKANFESVLDVTYHEGFHQYIYYAFNQSQCSVWFNEGHAVFFEGAEIKSGRLQIEESEHSMEMVTQMLELDRINVKRLLEKSYEEFYVSEGGHTSKVLRSQNYALAWAIIYYLRKGTAIEKGSPYSKVLEKYYKAFKSSKNAETATISAFKGIDIIKFQSDLIEFFSSKSKRKKAERNKIFKSYKGKKY